MEQKICRKCDVILNNENWFKSSQLHHQNICKKCCSIRIKEYTTRKPRRVWASGCLRSKRSKNRGANFIVNLTIDELENLANKTDRCSICDKELDWSRYSKSKQGKRTLNSPSLDRINNGEVIDINNVWIVCYECSTMKYIKPMSEYVKLCKYIYLKFKDEYKI